MPLNRVIQAIVRVPVLRKLVDTIKETPLLVGSFRIYEALKLVHLRTLLRNVGYWQRGAPDKLPIPPIRLVVLVSGSANLNDFFIIGQRIAQNIQYILHEYGLDIDQVESILDFGCGCGRVLQHWHGLKEARARV